MTADELPFRPNVCMLVLSRDGRIFLGERNGEPGIWQLPQGGVEAGASLEENVLREVEEELGVSRAKLGAPVRLTATHRYEFDKPPRYAAGKWRGQSQTFWIVPFLGEDSDIVLDRHHPEFMSWRWCSVEELRALAEPKRLPGYEKVIPEFLEYLQKLACR